MKRSLFAIAFFFLGTTPFARAQPNSNTGPNVDGAEKIYVHTDRDFYLTGEILWFSLHVYSDLGKKPFSKVAYLELINASSHPVAQLKVLIENGQGSGAIFLPATFASGYYRLRSYTNWMKNTHDFFYKDISIVNAFKDNMVANSDRPISFSAQFFPEGGVVVNGFENKVGVQVVDQYGKGIDFIGAVISKTDTVLRFKSLKFGIGHFLFTPNLNEQYRFLLKTKNGVKFFPFPERGEAGCAVRLQENETDLEVKVKPAALVEANKLVLSVGNIVATPEQGSEGSAQVYFKVPKSRLPAGVSQILIKWKEDTVATRLYFKKTESEKLAIQDLKQEYGLREKVVLKIQNTKPANLSISVAKVDSFPSVQSISFSSYFWLESLLKSPVENPDYYFSRTDSDVNLALDNLMLVAQLRHQNLIAKSGGVTYTPELQGHQIKVSRNSKDTISQNVSLSLLGDTPGFYVNKSKGNSVSFELLNQWGPRKAVIQEWKDSTCSYNVVSPFSTETEKFEYAEFELTNNLKKNLLERSLSMQLQDIYYEEEMNETEKNKRDSTSFYGQADETYLLNDYTRFPDMEDVLREYVKGVDVKKSKNHYFLTVKGVYDRRNQPLILIDFVPVQSHDAVVGFDPLKVKKIEVVTKPYQIGDMTFDGIISFTTFKGDLGGYTLPGHYHLEEYQGYQEGKKFYSPDYDKHPNTHRPDQRSLLYWKPNIQIGKNDTDRHVAFFTSDIPGTYKIVVEGISVDGLPIYFTQLMKIKK